jgi:NADH-quinone oxidoreductase subunit M
MVYRVFFGGIAGESNRSMPDMNLREILLMVPLAVLMFVLGVVPTPFLEKSERSAAFILETIEAKQLAVERFELEVPLLASTVALDGVPAVIEKAASDSDAGSNQSDLPH